MKKVIKKIKKITPYFIKRRYRGVIRRFRGVIHRGNRVVCPICNSRFNEFGPFGATLRKNAQCYYCESLERPRLLWKYLNDKTDLFNDKKQKRLLHFAPERMFYRIFSSEKQIEYVPCDLFPKLYNYGGGGKNNKGRYNKYSFRR